METGLLLLRGVLGLTIAAHGAQKLLGWFGGYGLDGTGGWLESMGFRPGRAFAGLNGITELAAGSLIVLGFLTPLAAAGIAGVMIVAIALVHLAKGFFNEAGGYEFNLLIIAGAITLAFTGPGRISIDSALGWDLNGFVWGIGALALAVVGAGLALATRRPLPAESAEDAPQEAQAA